MEKNSKKYECKLCFFSSNKKCNYISHLKTLKHIKNENEKNESLKIKKFFCECGKNYKYNSGLWRHKKKCNIIKNMQNMKKEITKLKNDNKIMKDTTNEILEIIKQSSANNKELINEMKMLKSEKNVITQNITNNTQNISINVFLNQHCKNAMNLADFMEKIHVTIEDLKYTGQTNYVEGISRILIKNLNKLSKIDRPIHCSDVKRNVLYIKNDEGWEKDKKHDKINKCIKDVEFKQIQKIPEWKKEENINIYKNNVDGMKYQKVVFNSMGGIDPEKREKNKNYIIKKISQKTDFKE